MNAPNVPFEGVGHWVPASSISAAGRMPAVIAMRHNTRRTMKILATAIALAAAVFLATDAARWVTGQNIGAGGGVF